MRKKAYKIEVRYHMSPKYNKQIYTQIDSFWPVILLSQSTDRNTLTAKFKFEQVRLQMSAEFSLSCMRCSDDGGLFNGRV